MVQRSANNPSGGDDGSPQEGPVPLDYHAGRVRLTYAQVLRRFEWSVLASAAAVNTALLVTSLLHPTVAVGLGLFVSPFLNVMLVLGGAFANGVVRDRFGPSFPEFVGLAMWAPIVGALVNAMIGWAVG